MMSRDTFDRTTSSEPVVKIIRGIKTLRGKAFEYLHRTTLLKEETQERRYLERITTDHAGNFAEAYPHLTAIGNGSIHILGFWNILNLEMRRATRMRYWNDMRAAPSIIQRVQTDFDSGRLPFLIGVNEFLKSEGKYLAEARLERRGIFGMKPILYGMFFVANN